MEAISLDALTALEPLPSEEELLASNTVRDFVAEKILPLIGEHFERHTFPDELNSEVGELGLFGADHRRLRLRRRELGHLRIDAPETGVRPRGAYVELGVHYTYEGTNEVHSLIIGRGLTGFDAF